MQFQMCFSVLSCDICEMSNVKLSNRILFTRKTRIDVICKHLQNSRLMVKAIRIFSIGVLSQFFWCCDLRSRGLG